MGHILNIINDISSLVHILCNNSYEVFDNSKHDLCNYFDDKNQCYCCNIFSVFIQKGETANANEIITSLTTHNAYMLHPNNNRIYSTDLPNIQYIKQHHGKFIVIKGKIKYYCMYEIPRTCQTFSIIIICSWTLNLMGGK